MFAFRVNVKSTVRVAVPSFTTEQMRDFGESAIEVQQDRIRRAINVYDAPAKPLTPPYAKFKRRQGAKPIRDLTLTGDLLRAMIVTRADETGVRIGFGSRPQYVKAHANQERERMFGLSSEDKREITKTVRNTFAENVATKGVLVLAGAGLAAAVLYSLSARPQTRGNVIMMPLRPARPYRIYGSGNVVVIPASYRMAA